jgi:hypothetical protein
MALTREELDELRGLLGERIDEGTLDPYDNFWRSRRRWLEKRTPKRRKRNAKRPRLTLIDTTPRQMPAGLDAFVLSRITHLDWWPIDNGEVERVRIQKLRNLKDEWLDLNRTPADTEDDWRLRFGEFKTYELYERILDAKKLERRRIGPTWCRLVRRDGAAVA